MREAVLVALVLSLASIGAPVAQAAERDPILFVHGWSGSVSQFDTMVARFKADGWTGNLLWGLSYNSWASNKTTAGQVRDAVDYIRAQTGATKVDVVTHSMGGLNTRWYLKFLGGDTKIDDWVSIAGPNHGTNTAYGCWTTSCYEMRYNSSFLTDLNAGDETPGTVNHGTFWSPCDGVINPDESVVLSGATNTRTACLGHNEMLGNLAVYEGVREFVRW